MTFNNSQSILALIVGAITHIIQPFFISVKQILGLPLKMLKKLMKLEILSPLRS